jgi:hypothetical protein
VQFLASARSPARLAPDGRNVLRLALIISFPVIGLDKFLRTTPAQLSGQPLLLAQGWVTDSLMALPLFAVSVWAAGWIASQAGLGLVSRPDVLKRAVLIALLAALALVPLWFELNRVDAVAQAQALVTPHSHGSDDVYWVGSAAIVALVYVSLVPAAVWAGHSITSQFRNRLPRRAGALVRGSVFIVLVAAVPVLAWLLHQAAQRAYASQVNYTSASLLVRVHSHALSGAGHGSAGPPVTAAPFAFAYQLAHALQDGLAGQAAGFPVTVIALLWSARRSPGRDAASRQLAIGG